MSDKYYWLWDKETKVVDHNAIKAQFRAGQHHIPRSALRVEPKPAKEGFKVIVVMDGNVPKGTEYIEDHIGKLIFDESDCTQFKQMEKLGPIPDGWTSDEPKTPYDEWFNGAWVTNESNKYIAEYAQVDATRESLYRAQTDPLENKARRLERNGATAEELRVYYDRIDELEAKIKTENPWPEPPTN